MAGEIDGLLSGAGEHQLTDGEYRVFSSGCGLTEPSAGEQFVLERVGDSRAVGPSPGLAERVGSVPSTIASIAPTAGSSPSGRNRRPL
nr:hypothetical protein [Micromonospora sp. DSM 115978]